MDSKLKYCNLDPYDFRIILTHVNLEPNKANFHQYIRTFYYSR